MVLQYPSWVIPVLTSSCLLATDSLDSKEMPDTTHFPFQNRYPGLTLFSSPSCTGQDMYVPDWRTLPVKAQALLLRNQPCSNPCGLLYYVQNPRVKTLSVTPPLPPPPFVIPSSTRERPRRHR